MTPKKLDYTCVLFDMDGVLLNSIGIWIEVIRDGLKELGIVNVSPQHIVKGIMKFEFYAKLGVKDLDMFGARLSILFGENAEKIDHHENVYEVLEELTKRNIQLGVVTTSRRKAVDALFERFGLKKYFKIVICNEDVKNNKPHPEGIIKAMKYLKATPEKTMMVGDTRNDILAGKVAEVTTVLYYPPHHHTIYDRDHLLGLCADYYITDLSEMLDIV